MFSEIVKCNFSEQNFTIDLSVQQIYYAMHGLEKTSQKLTGFVVKIIFLVFQLCGYVFCLKYQLQQIIKAQK